MIPLGRMAAVFGCAGPVLLPEERAFFREADPLGFILFARNVEDPAQLARLTADLREAVGRDAPVLVDQEGGRVQRLRGPHWREWQPPLDTVAALGDQAPRALFLRAQLIAAELRAVGIDCNCAPVADILVKILKAREERVHQLFDVFHQPAFIFLCQIKIEQVGKNPGHRKSKHQSTDPTFR